MLCSDLACCPPECCWVFNFDARSGFEWPAFWAKIQGTPELNIAWVGGGQHATAGAASCLSRGGIAVFSADLSFDNVFARAPALAMMLSLYVTLGVFLLLASRNPSAHSSLILFTA